MHGCVWPIKVRSIPLWHQAPYIVVEMITAINIYAYSDALVVLGTAGIIVPLLQRQGLNPVLGYLAGGALLGPLGLGSYASAHPIVRWITVTDAKNVSGIADLGVV